MHEVSGKKFVTTQTMSDLRAVHLSINQHSCHDACIDEYSVLQMHGAMPGVILMLQDFHDIVFHVLCESQLL